ncbi:hypothetical protein NUW54_g11411 [Trametes sanguinea]|uniref:Uncharacterized protein n=1 Tax=Trametes sanguinea TaxID=158606 RepID=A0ACC1NF87_9APHY|nr:hypothetical protein NUW54_g11411 [Trametes sanguinea]
MARLPALNSTARRRKVQVDLSQDPINILGGFFSGDTLYECNWGPDMKASAARLMTVVSTVSLIERADSVGSSSSPSRESKCSLCDKKFAQASTLSTHMHTHQKELEKKKPHVCHMSKRNGTQCKMAFGDSSSLLRHLKEQHRGATYECPVPGCVDRANKQKRSVPPSPMERPVRSYALIVSIKRLSEFKKHLAQKHGIVVEDANQYSVTMWTDEPLPIAGPVAGPSKPRKRRTAKRDAALVTSEPTFRGAVCWR